MKRVVLREIRGLVRVRSGVILHRERLLPAGGQVVQRRVHLDIFAIAVAVLVVRRRAMRRRRPQIFM